MVYVDRGAFLFNRRKNAELAVADFRRALAINPAFEAARQNLELSYAAQSADEAELSGATLAVQKNPGNAAALVQRGRVQMIRANYDAALSDFGRAISLTPETNAPAMRAYCLPQAGRLDESIADNIEICRREPGNVAARDNVGFSYDQLRRVPQAIAVFRQVLQLQPELHMAQEALALLEKLLETRLHA